MWVQVFGHINPNQTILLMATGVFDTGNTMLKYII